MPASAAPRPATARTASQRTQRKRPGDLTGVRGQQLAAQAAREKEEATREVQETIAAERKRKRAEEVDYRSDPDTDPGERVRVNFPIEKMTFGKEVISQAVVDAETGQVKVPAVIGNLRQYDFEEGVWYQVDTELAAHLEYLGYVYD